MKEKLKASVLDKVLDKIVTELSEKKDEDKTKIVHEYNWQDIEIL
jgi:hypothetical protein